MKEPLASMSPAEVLALVAKTTFQPFAQSDWYAFAGCDSDNPLRGEDGDITIILDADSASLYRENDWAIFVLSPHSREPVVR